MIKFSKFHGFSNDYIVLAAKDLSKIESLADFAVRICDRHRGVGADGLAIFEKFNDDAADFSVRIINPDGSEAGFSGNGTRCAAAHLFHANLWQNSELKLSLSSGIKKYRLLERESHGGFIFEAEIGHPKFDSAAIPMLFAENRKDVVDFPLEIAGESFLITVVNVGNPVTCVFVPNFDALDWRKIGAEIENRAVFIERTNVVFVKILNSNNLAIRIWERGAGETSSSGTCSVAAAVAAAYTEKSSRQVAVHAVGGTTQVLWRESDDEMLLTGRADLAFSGEYDPKIRTDLSQRISTTDIHR